MTDLVNTPERAPEPYKPSKRQVAYLTAWLDPQAPKTIEGIARHINVPSRTIHYWLKDARFMAWLNTTLDNVTDALWRPVLLKLADLAVKGSVEHAKLLAQIRGAIKTGDDGGRPSVGVQVVVGIPRPGDRVELPADHTLPSLPPPPSSEQH